MWIDDEAVEAKYNFDLINQGVASGSHFDAEEYMAKKAWEAILGSLR